MDESGLVGGTQIPVPAGLVGEKFTDPVVEALLGFAAFYIKQAIDAKLANLTGTSPDAVPLANRFSFDPLEPRGHQIKLPTPALYVYWDGKSSWSKQTMIYTTRQREIHMMYVFEELPAFSEMERRSGLMNAVDAAMFQMSVRQVHTSHGPWINDSLGSIWWEWAGGQPGRFGIDEGPLAERRAAKKSGRDHPALKGMWIVEERVAGETLVDPDDVTHDMNFGIYASDDVDVVHFMDRYLTAPDGTEQDDG